jgi:hypothetical protein
MLKLHFPRILHINHINPRAIQARDNQMSAMDRRISKTTSTRIPACMMDFISDVWEVQLAQDLQTGLIRCFKQYT